MGRKLAIDPRQIEHRCNRTHLVIVRHHLFKAERIKQLLLIPLQPTHHGPFPPLTASTSENHCSRKSSTDFCNKICQKRTHAPQYRLVVLQIEFAGMDRSSLQSSSALRFAAPVISTASARRRCLL